MVSIRGGFWALAGQLDPDEPSTRSDQIVGRFARFLLNWIKVLNRERG